METWLFWLIAAAILGIGEVVTTGFFLGMFAVGAVAAAVVALIGAGAALSLVAFVAVSALGLVALRPVARRHMRQAPALRTGTAALVGRTATVTERIANDEDVGCVRLEGEIWRARAYDDDEVIETGTRVHVLEIRGVTALVAQ